jgi:hypothetical protein
MSAAIPPFPLYACIACISTTWLKILSLSFRQYNVGLQGMFKNFPSSTSVPSAQIFRLLDVHQLPIRSVKTVLSNKVCRYDDMNHLDDKLLTLILCPQFFEFTKLPYHENHYFYHLHCDLVLFLSVFCVYAVYQRCCWT